MTACQTEYLPACPLGSVPTGPGPHPAEARARPAVYIQAVSATSRRVDRQAAPGRRRVRRPGGDGPGHSAAEFGASPAGPSYYPARGPPPARPAAVPSGNPYPLASFTHLSYTRDMTWISYLEKSYDVIYQRYDMDILNANNLERHILVIYFLTFGQIF